MKTIRFLQTVTLMVTVVILLSFSGNTAANEANGKRLALVIGNGDYAVNPITTAANDAHAIAASLKELGYEVFYRNNLDRERMLNSVSAFEKELAGAELGLFFYIGHGVQYNNANYLVPLGAQVESDWQIKETCVALNDVAEKVARSGLKTGLFFIDAARANPLGPRFSPAQNGLTQMVVPDNLHLFLADAPNRLTRQGDAPLPEAGNISVFAATFLALLKEVPGLSIDQFFEQLQLAISVSSRQDRNPWFYLGQNDVITLYDDQALFTQALGNISPDISLKDAQELMLRLFGAPQTSDIEDHTETPHYPWADNPILLFHTLLRDLEKLHDVQQMNLPEKLYQAGVAALNAKFGHLIEAVETAAAPETLLQKEVLQIYMSEVIDQNGLKRFDPKYDHLMDTEKKQVTPETLLEFALTRTWPWTDPYRSPELAAKTIAAIATQKAKEAEEAAAIAEEIGLFEAETEVEEETETAPSSSDKDGIGILDFIEKELVEVVNPAIAQFKSSLILEQQKALLKASRLSVPMKQAALSAAESYADEMKISSTAFDTLLEEAMAVYHPPGRMALMISDGEADPDTGDLSKRWKRAGLGSPTQPIPMNGFMVSPLLPTNCCPTISGSSMSLPIG